MIEVINRLKNKTFCTMEMCITGHSTDGKHIHSTWKNPGAFPHPANVVSHSFITRPVIHIPTAPATAKSIPSFPIHENEK